MPRIFAGVVLLALTLGLAGCGSTSSTPMRFQFFLPGNANGTVTVNEGGVSRGDATKTYNLKSNDAGKALEFQWGNNTVYGKMDVYGHTDLTRISTVPVYLTSDIVDAVKDFKAVTYVVYQRRRDLATAGRRTGAAGEEVQLRVYDYGDTVTREALIEQARLQGEVIAVIDFGSSPYIR